MADVERLRSSLMSLIVKTVEATLAKWKMKNGKQKSHATNDSATIVIRVIKTFNCN
jgi:hypothetical protein